MPLAGACLIDTSLSCHPPHQCVGLIQLLEESIMPRISRQLSSKKSSIGKRSAIVALAALFFYIVQVFINLHQTIFVDLLANSTQYQLYGSTEFTGSAVKQESDISRTPYRSSVKYTGVKYTGITGNSFREAHNIDNGNAAPGLVLPNILIIGAQKAGTTSIAALLHENGVCRAQIFPGEPNYFEKEVHFFDTPNRYNEGIEFYAKRFEKCAPQKKQFILDATPDYLNIAYRVHEIYTDKKAQNSAINNLKLICILREPISRELSWYNHKLSVVLEGKDDEYAYDIVHENSTIKTFDEYSNGLAQKMKGTHPGSYSVYVAHLKEWVKWFDRKNLLILSYDELVQEPSMVIQRIEKFLGTKLTGSLPHTNSQENPQKVKVVSSHAKEVLGSVFRDKNEELYRFIRDHPGPPMEQNPFPRFEDV